MGGHYYGFTINFYIKPIGVIFLLRSSPVDFLRSKKMSKAPYKNILALMKDKMDPLIHFPFYCNQYMGMLAKYTYEQQGAFLRTLCAYITEDGMICDNDSKYRLLGAYTQSEKKAIDHVFDVAISLAKEITKNQKNKREINRENGKKGGRPNNQ